MSGINRTIAGGLTGAAFATALFLGLPALAKSNGENLSEKVAPKAAQTTLPNGAPSSFADLVATVSPAVVSIMVEREIPAEVRNQQGPNFDDLPEPFKFFFGPGNGPSAPRGPVRAEGSGFVVDPTGYIVTNNHVVADGEKISVTLNNGDVLPAKLVGRDPGTDLALLKVDSDKQLSYVPFAAEDNLRVGDWVVAVGNPFGLGGTVTAGIVSARGREIAAGNYNDFIQIDAPINQGNSGGPTFDLQGRVVGVNTLIFSPSGGNVGIGFAIPASTAKDIIEELKNEGEIARGYLGVRPQTITDEIADSMDLKSTEGAIVVSVLPDSPAERAGFKVGDVITDVNGTTIKDPRHLTQVVGKLKPNDSAKIKVIRDRKTKTIKAKIAKREDEVVRPQPEEMVQSSAAALGLSLSALDESMRSRAGIPSDVQGVIVTNVAPYSEAQEKGIRPGDVILEVADQIVTTPGQVNDLIKAAEDKGSSNVLLFIRSRDTNRFVALSLEGDN
ncbi:MAG: Do family serine endopeptidase [Alphaproteobacteria bacterium]|nr:MAG: Do family serine endopeptidase [Alphaproteobacteria bacterium]